MSDIAHFSEAETVGQERLTKTLETCKNSTSKSVTGFLFIFFFLFQLIFPIPYPTRWCNGCTGLTWSSRRSAIRTGRPLRWGWETSRCPRSLKSSSRTSSKWAFYGPLHEEAKRKGLINKSRKLALGCPSRDLAYTSSCDLRSCSFYDISVIFCFNPVKSLGVAVISVKNHKRQRRKRQSVTAKREKSRMPKFLTAILTLPNLT